MRSRKENFNITSHGGLRFFTGRWSTFSKRQFISWSSLFVLSYNITWGPLSVLMLRTSQRTENCIMEGNSSEERVPLLAVRLANFTASNSLANPDRQNHDERRGNLRDAIVQTEDNAVGNGEEYIPDQRPGGGGLGERNPGGLPAGGLGERNREELPAPGEGGLGDGNPVGPPAPGEGGRGEGDPVGPPAPGENPIEALWWAKITLFSRAREDQINWQQLASDRWNSFLFIIVAVLAAFVIACIQWVDRPSVLVAYASNNPVPVSNAFSCRCALPDFLKGIDDAGPDTSPVKSCYDLKSGDVETVTVVSFSNSTVPDLLELVHIVGDEDNAGANVGVPLKPVFKMHHDSYLITSNLSEFNLWKEDTKKMLNPLYKDFTRYFSGMETVDMGVQEILDTKLFTFPSYYMLMMVQFVCVRYSSCAPGVILSMMDSKFVARNPSATSRSNSTAYVTNDWLTCGGYDGRKSWDPIRNSYHGRCMVYPTYPTMDSRVKRLLIFMSKCPEITQLGGHFNHTDFVTFVSRMEQVNQSRVTEREPMVMGYLEVRTSSPLWVRLADTFPGVRFECPTTSEYNVRSSPGAWTEVCNASSVCLTYKTAADVGFSSVRMKCLDFDRYNYTNCVVLADSTGNTDRVDDLCNPHAACKFVPSRKVRREVKSRTELNNMNVKVIESEIQESGKRSVCRNTFRAVVRYNSELLNQTVFLETNCSTSAGLCNLTGRYMLLDDEPGIDIPRVLNEKKVVDAASVRKPFVCYGPGKQKTTFWVITTAGVISGWISSMHFVAELLYPAVINARLH